MPDQVRVAIEHAQEDHELLVHVVDSLRPMLCDLSAECTWNRGGDSEEERLERLIDSHVLVLLHTASVWKSDFLMDVGVPCMIARHRAGEAITIVVRAKPAYLPELAQKARLVPSDRYLSSSAHAIEDVLEAVGAAVKMPRKRTLCTESALEQQQAEQRRKAAWRHRFKVSVSTELPSEQPMVPGAFVRHGTTQLRRRVVSAPHASIFCSYDYDREQDVWVHVPVPDMKIDDGLAAMLRCLHRVGGDEMFRVLEPLCVEAGEAYYVTEPIRGVTLKDAILDGSFEWQEAKSGLIEIAECLQRAHDRGIVHGALDVDQIRLDTVPGGAHARRMRLVWPAVIGELPRAEGLDARLPDVRGLGAILLFSLHGAALPAPLLPHTAEAVLTGVDAPSGVKALAMRWLFSEAEATRPMAEIVEDLRRALAGDASIEVQCEMIRLDGGAFWMGSDGGSTEGAARARPVRRVRLSPFLIAKYAVSCRLYRETMGRGEGAGVDDDLPVTRVRFRDAIEFCNRLSDRLGFQRVYAVDHGRVIWIRTANGFRLPTEAEWEFAARGPEGRSYPWGEEPPQAQVCWNGEGNPLMCGNRRGPSPVWSHADGATPTGIIGLAGNVWEWCFDLYAPYEPTDEAVVDPAGPLSSAPPRHPAVVDGVPYRVMRGGAWNLQAPEWLLASARSFDREDADDPDVGLRVVRSVGPVSAPRR